MEIIADDNMKYKYRRLNLNVVPMRAQLSRNRFQSIRIILMILFACLIAFYALKDHSFYNVDNSKCSKVDTDLHFQNWISKSDAPTYTPMYHYPPPTSKKSSVPYMIAIALKSENSTKITKFDDLTLGGIRYDHERRWGNKTCSLTIDQDVIYNGLCLPNWGNVKGWKGISFPKESHLLIYEKLTKIGMDTKGVMFPSFRMKDECKDVTNS